MSLAKHIVRDSRPKQVLGRGDKYLADAADELARQLRKLAHGFTQPNCPLPDQLWGIVSPTVVEWAEDIHNGLGSGRPSNGINRKPWERRCRWSSHRVRLWRWKGLTRAVSGFCSGIFGGILPQRRFFRPQIPT